MLGKGHDSLYKAPSKEERGKQKAKSRERSDIKFIDLRFYAVHKIIRVREKYLQFCVSCIHSFINAGSTLDIFQAASFKF